MNPDTSAPNNFQGRCKSVMNVIRRAFSFRSKNPPAQENGEQSSGIEMTSMAKPRVDSLPTSDVASTSASCSQPRVPCVYEDPFVAVLADGTIFIKHFYNFNTEAEFKFEDIRFGHVKRNCRVVKAKEIVKVYYAPAHTCTDETLCKGWGVCMNDVWWASHTNRMESINIFTNVVFDDGSMIHAGFSVVNIDAFAESIQCVGLPKDAPFQSGLPRPPFSMLKIPYIDEDEDEAPAKRKTRRSKSKVGQNGGQSSSSNADEIVPI